MGFAPRVSATRKAASATAAAPSGTSVRAAVQPCSPPSISPYVSPPAASVNVAMPIQSSLAPPGRRDSSTPRTVSQPAISVMGRFTRKMARQCRCSVSRPPSTGATAAAAPFTPPHTPNAMPRRRPW